MSARPARISVIVPMKNAAAFIRDAIRTIQRQSVRPDQILVIDDGSTDASRDLVAGLARDDAAIRLLDGPGRGPGPARNVGLRDATGEFIAFLDADDLWPQGKMEAHMERFARAPHVDVTSGFVSYFNRQMEKDLSPDPQSITDEMFHVHLGATVYRRAVFDRIGVFDESFLYSEDVDLMLRVREADVPMSILNKVVLYYRRHENSMTSVHTPEEKRDFNRAVMLSIMRRKKAGAMRPLTPFSALVDI